MTGRMVMRIFFVMAVLLCGVHAACTTRLYKEHVCLVSQCILHTCIMFLSSARALLHGPTPKNRRYCRYFQPVDSS